MPQRFSHSVVLNLKGLRCMYFGKSPQGISDVHLRVRTVDLVLLVHFCGEKMGSQKSSLICPRSCSYKTAEWGPRPGYADSQSIVHFTIPWSLPGCGRGIKFMVSSFSLVFLPRTSKGQEDSFSWVLRHSIFSAQSQAWGLFYSVSNPIRQRFPTQQD